MQGNLQHLQPNVLAPPQPELTRAEELDAAVAAAVQQESFMEVSDANVAATLAELAAGGGDLAGACTAGTGTEQPQEEEGIGLFDLLDSLDAEGVNGARQAKKRKLTNATKCPCEQPAATRIAWACHRQGVEGHCVRRHEGADAAAAVRRQVPRRVARHRFLRHRDASA